MSLLYEAACLTPKQLSMVEISSLVRYFHLEQAWESYVRGRHEETTRAAQAQQAASQRRLSGQQPQPLPVPTQSTPFQTQPAPFQPQPAPYQPLPRRASQPEAPPGFVPVFPPRAVASPVERIPSAGRPRSSGPPPGSGALVPYQQPQQPSMLAQQTFQQQMMLDQQRWALQQQQEAMQRQTALDGLPDMQIPFAQWLTAISDVLTSSFKALRDAGIEDKTTIFTLSRSEWTNFVDNLATQGKINSLQRTLLISRIGSALTPP